MKFTSTFLSTLAVTEFVPKITKVGDDWNVEFTPGTDHAWCAVGSSANPAGNGMSGIKAYVFKNEENADLTAADAAKKFTGKLTNGKATYDDTTDMAHVKKLSHKGGKVMATLSKDAKHVAYACGPGGDDDLTRISYHSKDRGIVKLEEAVGEGEDEGENSGEGEDEGKYGDEGEDEGKYGDEGEYEGKNGAKASLSVMLISATFI